MAKTKESAALEACTKDTLLGNKISVRMLEYLSTTKNHPEGFELLAREFLDICRILFSIEAGLDDCAKTGRRFPPDMVAELERKFKTTFVDFQELDRMLHKFLEYENKGTMGRLHKGFRRMFPDHDISRMRDSLAKSREALRMSALVFQWSLGDARIEDSVGIGYTGLAAALERMHGNRPALNASSSAPSPTTATGSGGASTPATAVSTPASANGASDVNNNNNNGAASAGAGAAGHGQAATDENNGPNVHHPHGPGNLARTRTGEQPSLPALPNSSSSSQPKSMLDVGVPNNHYGARGSSMLTLGHNGHVGIAGNNNNNGGGDNASGHGHGGVHVNGHGRIVHDDSTPLPSLPPMQFMAERDSGKELNFSDDLRLMPELRRRPSTSNNTIDSARDINGIVGAALTTNTGSSANASSGMPARSNTRVTSTAGGSSHHGSSSHHGHGGGGNNNSRSNYDSNGLLDHLEVMSITASTAGDSDSHAHGLQPPTKIKVVHLKADPASMPTWAPRNTVGSGGSGNMRSALITAVQGANYTLVEQLLDRGVSADGGVLHEAVLHHDVESMRLLLLFGADPNGADKDGVTPLFACVEESFVEGATLLLKYGAEPNRDSHNPTKDTTESPLVSAFTTGKLGLAQLMLAYGGDPNQRVQKGGSSSDSDSGGDNSTTLLMGAIGKKKHRRLVDLLLAYGANANQKDGMGTSPLFVAVQAGRSDIVTALLDHGADPNLPGPKHVLWPSTYHPSCLRPLLARGADLRKAPGILELATSLNKLETVRVLIKAGVDANSSKDGVYTPLCTAIRDDHIDIFNFLLANGADPNMPATEYPTWKCITHKRVHLLPPLVRAGADLHKPPGIVEMAVQVGYAEGLVWLLEKGGVQPDERNSKGHTALTTALRMNRPDLVQLLLDHGADAGARGEEWPLILAVQHPNLLQMLLPHVSNPRAVRGVLERAVAAGEMTSVKLLLAAGVSVEDKTGGVFSPLTTSIREGHTVLTKFLLDEAGADPNAPGEHLPLVKALRRGHTDEDGGAENLGWLLARGGDINKTYRGWNAIMQVVEDGNLELLKLLVEKSHMDVDLDVADDDGRTLRQMVAERGWPEGEQYLMAHAKA